MAKFNIGWSSIKSDVVWDIKTTVEDGYFKDLMKNIMSFNSIRYIGGNNLFSISLDL